MSDVFEFNYNQNLSASFQGQLSSSYNAWLTSSLQGIADYFGFLAKQQGADLDTALAVKSAVEAGDFALVDLFGAAQAKGNATANPTDPQPKLVIGGLVFDLSNILGGLETEHWTTSNGGKNKDTTTHFREFFTEINVPAYDENWDVPPPVNHDPTATAFTVELTEDVSAQPIDLLATALDPDAGDTLSVVADSIVVTVSGALAGTNWGDYLTINPDGTVVFDTSFDLLKDQLGVVQISYTITDGNGGFVDNAATIQYTGTADQYSVTSTTFTKIGGDIAERSFSYSFGNVPVGAYDAVVTVDLHADLNASNESFSLDIEPSGDVDWFFVGNQSNSSSTEQLLDYASEPIEVVASAYADGTLSVNGVFSQQVANGSSATVTLDYWA